MYLSAGGYYTTLPHVGGQILSLQSLRIWQDVKQRWGCEALCQGESIRFRRLQRAACGRWFFFIQTSWRSDMLSILLVFVLVSENWFQARKCLLQMLSIGQRMPEIGNPPSIPS